jgi:ribA/ribD-fused uncharacterized protein
MQSSLPFWSQGEAQYRYLSNFFPAPITLEGKQWPSVEHYYQAQKCLDASTQERIRQASTAREARSLGQAADVREDWPQVKVQVMARALKAKFTQHPELGEQLLATGECHLIHYAPWDSYWGTGKNSHGQNQLGDLLMRLRAYLRKKQERKPLRLIIAGSRDFADYDLLCRSVEAFQKEHGPIGEIICGMARGADLLGHRYADEHGIPVREMPADWDRYGKGAGYRRNGEMALCADALLAFRIGASKGTGHMIDIARQRNLIFMVVQL